MGGPRARRGVSLDRLHAGPLADAEAAESLCRKLAKRQVRCLVTPAA